MSKGFITGTNEELIKAYKESRDESYLKELIEANKGLINLLVSPYLTSIPNSELEDLTSESYIPMLRAIEDYDPEQGVAFSTLLKVYVRQHLNRLYNEATRQKRFTGTTPDSLDRLSEPKKKQTITLNAEYDDLGAGRKIFRGKYYIVQKGDNLWNIAKRFYGAGAEYYRIVRKNHLQDTLEGWRLQRAVRAGLRQTALLWRSM